MKYRTNKPKIQIVSGQFAAGKVYGWQIRAGNGKLMASSKYYDQRGQAVRAAKITKWIFRKLNPQIDG